MTDLMAWYFHEHPNESEVVDDDFSLEDELRKADQDAGGDGKLPDDFEPI